MRRFFLAVFLLLPLPALAGAPVTVDIRWEYHKFGAKVELYEVDDRPRLWETKSVKSLAEAPVTDRIESSSIRLNAGRKKHFALVIRNETTEPLYFFAAPHVINPVEHSLGFKFKCLCINHAFAIGPGEVWYRIVEFWLSKNFVGDRLTVTHSIINLDKTRAEAFALKPKPFDF